MIRHIHEIHRENAGRGRPSYSIEFFPPKTPKMEETLWDAVQTLAPFNPRFVSVTYGAGGSTRERTHATVARIARETPIPAAAHLTCVEASRAEIDAVAEEYWAAGVRHIVALRGDMPTPGAAFVAQDVDAVVPYGFWYERGLGPTAGETVSGVEAYASIPVIWRQLRLDATYTDFFTQPARPYLPARLGRAALEYHWVFRGGNLEPTLRAEMIARGPARTLDLATGTLAGTTEQYAIFNFLVQFRVLDVRAFWRLENAFNRDSAFDIPGLTLPGQRALVGGRGFFRD